MSAVNSPDKVWRCVKLRFQRKKFGDLGRGQGLDLPERGEEGVGYRDQIGMCETGKWRQKS